MSFREPCLSPLEHQVIMHVCVFVCVRVCTCTYTHVYEQIAVKSFRESTVSGLRA